ncbi:hypothetical protein [Micromonospora echinofusca]|uniref:Uncharacterized protein n=1 Tax=Micromonospora echinofusca TaxID=47858 RepID=A0ABS3VR01_MICEH|nr:hypothetical protein [Micromonospora echinofusca]MBO4206809.1 hypothetical protein [Micromonospora echinofusca]
MSGKAHHGAGSPVAMDNQLQARLTVRSRTDTQEARVQEKRETAERLTLVTTVGPWFHLDQPVLVGRGQTYWVDNRTSELCIDRGDGRITRVAGWVCR